MTRAADGGVVSLGCFIESIRDAGYRGPAAALAELVDNAWEAGAREVRISVAAVDGDVRVTVQDDGCGMSPAVLGLALQFGGTTRFDSRVGLGRYGMGLPAASVSQAQRVEVHTWAVPGEVWWTYLDVEEVRRGRLRGIPSPRLESLPRASSVPSSYSGTVITWSRCDRLRTLELADVVHVLRLELGPIFREQLWSGRVLLVNDRAVEPFDPLFVRGGRNVVGAVPFGGPLEFPVEVQDDRGRPRSSKVVVRFVELPVEAWAGLSNDEKQRLGISKRAGLSVLRSGREVDSGWFFMGRKRKENYDDWWRAELRFEPVLDELFGVSHIKQGIRPQPTLVRLLAPDIEHTAHELNRRVRRRFMALRPRRRPSGPAALAASRDRLLDPVAGARVSSPRRGRAAGLVYRISDAERAGACFFEPKVGGGELVLEFNRQHPFFDAISSGRCQCKDALALLLLAAARAELWHRGPDRPAVTRFRRRWSKALMAFLS